MKIGKIPVVFKKTELIDLYKQTIESWYTELSEFEKNILRESATHFDCDILFDLIDTSTLGWFMDDNIELYDYEDDECPREWIEQHCAITFEDDMK